jgi:predicted RNA-binding protein YlxR (DUF448 family)
MLARADHSESDAGPRAAGTHRLCMVTREVKPVEEMIRFVLGPDLAIVPDLKRRLPGRGVWITARRDILAAAVKQRIFARGFRAEAKVASDLPDVVGNLLERSLLDALSIARKAGALVAGFGKVEAAVEHRAAIALLHACDAGSEGARQIMAAVRRGYGSDAAKIVVIDLLTSAQLDLALGRPNVVHAALLAGRASNTVLARWRALERFRTSEPEDRRKHPNLEAPVLGLE